MDKIIKEVELVMTGKKRYKAMSQAHNPYGDGNAMRKIISCIQGNM